MNRWNIFRSFRLDTHKKAKYFFFFFKCNHRDGWCCSWIVFIIVAIIIQQVSIFAAAHSDFLTTELRDV